MKYFLLFSILVFIACNGEPAIAPPTPETVWVDADTRSDTIITNVDDHAPEIYFAYHNWHVLAIDPNLSHGLRFIAIRKGDSILVKPLNDPTTNYDGPFICGNSQNSDTLRSQNFLDASSLSPVKNYIRLQ
jgi:hypothetical protein